MRQLRERRRHIRYIGQHLLIVINGKAHPIMDISIGGVSFQGTGFTVGDPLSLTLVSAFANKDVMPGIGEVRAISGSKVHVKFVRPTLPLLRYIIAHIAEVTGIEPHLLKRNS
jgi:hypothetical protein